MALQSPRRQGRRSRQCASRRCGRQTNHLSGPNRMKARKPRKPPLALEMDFEEALARLIQTDPKELTELIEEARREGKEVEEYVRERTRSIRRGARRATKRFRL